MSPRSKKEYIEAIFLRYKKASRKGKTIILNEFCATSGYHRKHAIRILREMEMGSGMINFLFMNPCFPAKIL
ncbi:MAG: hypothetical protein V2A69_14670 [Pseudomonadota bacterium]